MIRILKCRRSSLALIAMGLLTWIALKNGTDVGLSIATVVAGVAASNAYQGKGKPE